MLANGATLSYKKTGESGYTKLVGLKELPDMGTDPEKVENTCLEDTLKQYEMGIGDAGEMEYKFKYENGGATSSYRVLREMQESEEVVSFKEELKDGTTTTFDAQVAVKRSGAGVNGAIEFTAKMMLQSGLTIVDPS